MTGQGTRQFCIDVSALMHQKISEKAKAVGVPPARYAAMLLEAAWAARSGKSMGDGDLDAWVGACVLLYGGGVSTETIATALGVTPKIVNKMLTAWRRVINDKQTASGDAHG
jgi:hypothetical protein